MTEPTSPLTRTRLVQAAKELLWARSFQGTSVDEICSRAGAGKGSLYHFFPSKIDLAIAAIEASWADAKAGTFEPVFSSEPGGLEQLRRLLDAVDRLQLQASRKSGACLGCPFGGLGQEMAHQDERLRATLVRIFDAHCDYLERAIAAAVERGEIPPCDTRRKAEAVFALFEGALLIAKVANDPARFRDLAGAAVAGLA